jgi:PLP dependent protein
VLKAGHRNFGENRVQETAGKWPAIRHQYPDPTLHLIGPLQTNKAEDAVSLFDAIHTVDRPRIAEAIAKEMKRQNRQCKIFVQVNTGDEAQKAGVALRETDSFIRQCRDDYGLTLTGLMCIPPVIEAPDRHFQMLAEIAQRNGLAGLSMGMSRDFEIAIAYGATHIRVGSAIFGTR